MRGLSTSKLGILFGVLWTFHANGQSAVDPFGYSAKKIVTGGRGAVVSAHPLASAVGLDILKKGGNAFDAAIATQLALAVVHPSAGNIGGGGFLVAHQAGGRNIAIDYRERAPGAAKRDMYLDAKGNPVADLSTTGHLSAGVPGTVAGLFATMKYAVLPFRKLIQPAIELADKGFAITAAEARALNAEEQDFRKANTVLPVFVKAGGWKAGDTLVQKDLARTLALIRDLGAQGFYGGATAALIVAEMQRGHGIISLQDLAGYTARERTPMEFNYKADYTVITMPLPSSGGVVLPQLMRMVEDQPLKLYGFESAKAVHLMAEVERLAYADRARWLGDRDYVKVPVESLISYPYLYQRMSLYNPDSAGRSEKIGAGAPATESMQTTHLDVYDRDGNCVAVTTTLNGGYGSHTVVAGAGFLLNDEMDDFSIKPGVPNMYGALGGDANAIAPGKRMLSSMTPTIVLRGDSPYLIVGTPGGTTIITSVFQTLIDLLEFGLSPQDAVNKPKFHHQWMPDLLFVEKGFPADTRSQLEAMGYKLKELPSIGQTEVIRIGPGNQITAVADRRGDDGAEAW